MDFQIFHIKTLKIVCKQGWGGRLVRSYYFNIVALKSKKPIQAHLPYHDDDDDDDDYRR